MMKLREKIKMLTWLLNTYVTVWVDDLAKGTDYVPWDKIQPSKRNKKDLLYSNA